MWTCPLDHMCREYDRLAATLEYGRSSRRLRRDGQVAEAANELERAIAKLYVREDTDPDGHRLNIEQWDQYFPEADAWFVGLCISITRLNALAEGLSELADASISSPLVGWLLPAEPTVHPPSVRSEPDLHMHLRCHASRSQR